MKKKKDSPTRNSLAFPSAKQMASGATPAKKEIGVFPSKNKTAEAKLQAQQLIPEGANAVQPAVEISASQR
jgi:hypothetical protein